MASASLRPAIVGRNVATINPAEFSEPLQKCGYPLALALKCAGTQKADGWLPGRLRADAEGPSCCRATNERNEISPSHCLTRGYEH